MLRSHQRAQEQGLGDNLQANNLRLQAQAHSNQRKPVTARPGVLTRAHPLRPARRAAANQRLQLKRRVAALGRNLQTLDRRRRIRAADPNPLRERRIAAIGDMSKEGKRRRRRSRLDRDSGRRLLLRKHDGLQPERCVKRTVRRAAAQANRDITSAIGANNQTITRALKHSLFASRHVQQRYARIRRGQTRHCGNA